MERPAKVLLKNYKKLSESSTLRFYKRIIGKTAAKQQMTPTATFLAQIEFGKDHSIEDTNDGSH